MMLKYLALLLLMLTNLRARSQTNLYAPDASSRLIKWPIIEVGTHVYYMSVQLDTLANGLGRQICYFKSVNKQTNVLERTIIVSRDTAFNIYEAFQPVNVIYDFNTGNGKINFVIVRSSHNPSGTTLLKKYPKMMYFFQLDMSLNLVIPAKPIYLFNDGSRYTFAYFASITRATSNKTLIYYSTRDTVISNFNFGSVADKVLLLNDTGMVLTHSFLGWEPIGGGTYFPNHESGWEILRKPDNSYLVPNVLYTDSLGSSGMRHPLTFALNTNLTITDTFDAPTVVQFGTLPNLPAKRRIAFGGLTENHFFLPTGSLVRAALGSYEDSLHAWREYAYYGVGKADRNSGYRTKDFYFPPASDTDDYQHSSNGIMFSTVYQAFENRIFTFTSTQSDYNNDYCVNGRPNLGQLACIDTNLQQKWVKYIKSHDGYCIQTYNIAPCDGRKGVLVSGREFPLNDPNDLSRYKYFIYHVDSTTHLGVNDHNALITIRDRFVVYPNPTQDIVTIDDFLGKLAEVSVTNVQGQVIYQQQVTGKKVGISLASYPAGLYLIRARGTDNEVYSTKIVKK